MKACQAAAALAPALYPLRTRCCRRPATALLPATPHHTPAGPPGRMPTTNNTPGWLRVGRSARFGLTGFASAACAPT
jgi:hypothetical protein